MPLSRTAQAMGLSADRVKQRLLEALDVLMRTSNIEPAAHRAGGASATRRAA
jgi:hypothetical protein